MRKSRFAPWFPLCALAALGAALTGCPPVTITVTPTELTLEVGETGTLTATSSRAADTFAWSSDDEAVATVDASGVVTAVGAGTATITATGSSSGRTATATVTVTEAVEVAVTPTEATLEVGATVQLAATSTDAADGFDWASGDDTVATVDANGLVTAVGEGTTQVTATGTNSGESASATITVNPATVVSVTPTEASIEIGGTVALTANSSDAADTFFWESDAESVATVDAAGLVTGVGEGTAVVTATGSASGESASATITVTVPVEVSVAPSEATIQVGETVQLTPSSTDPLDAFTYESEDSLVASVDAGGLVTGVAPGTAAVSVTGTNSGKTASAAITVTAVVSESVLESFQEALTFVQGIPEPVVSPSLQEILIGLLTEAEELLLAGDPCGAAATLDEYLGNAQDLRETLLKRVKAGEFKQEEDVMGYPEWLFAQGRGTQYDLLVEQPGGNPCAAYARIGMPDSAEPGLQDASNLETTFAFGAPRPQVLFDPTDAVHTGLLLPAVQKATLGEPGTPELPAVRRLVAIPQGAAVEVDFEATIAETFKANLWPFQDQPVDQTAPTPDPTIGEEEPDPSVYGNPEFVRNDNLYGTDRPYPSSPVGITRLGRFRDMELIQVEVVGGQYNGVSDEVTLFSDVKVNLAFSGQTQGFVTENVESPFESSPDVYTNSVLNHVAVLQTPFIPPIVTPNFYGEEFLILTHPNFREAADALAAWKNEKGILTHVFECGTGSGITGRQTNTEIDTFIENRYDSTIVKPTYVLLLGDAEFIAPFYRPRMGDTDIIGTDWPYAERTYPGQEFPTLVPTFAVGRIPVDTLAQANTVVNKIIDYEKTPPGTVGPDAFYNRVTLASQFQCCRTDVANPGTAQRTFAEVSEFVRAALVGQGYSVQRIYQRTIDAAYGGDPTPRRYYNGTPLPAAIGPGSGFAWNGSTTDVVNAFNEGRFLIIHRDHGWSGGWGHPPFNWDHVPSLLSNGSFQPVVYSINCTSGYFDNETAAGGSFGTVYFTERLLRQADGGAVGVIGDTRVSPSWPNTALLRGLVDATWPNTVPSFGNNAKKRRLGDILNHAKLYILTQIGVAGQGTSYANAYNELILYHVFGDPTMEMWTSDPTNFLLPLNFGLLAIEPERIIIPYEFEGAKITVFQEQPRTKELVPIGRATVADGAADVEFFQPPTEDLPLLVSAAAEDAVGVSAMLDWPTEPQK